MMIGRYTDIPPGATNEPFNGVMFTSRIWNRALTSNEIRQLYQNPFRIYQQPKQTFANSISSALTVSKLALLGVG